MKINHIEFIGSFEHEHQCPKSNKPEYAFIGRSNVGKSSLINMLSERKEIAKISGTPGKTQTINYYLIDDTWYLVDLPGYGYAKISKTQRKRWRAMIERFLIHRSSLRCVFCLLDSRHPLQQLDRDFVNWMGESAIPFVVAYTKTDKVKPQNLNQNLDDIRTALLEDWETLPQEFITSALNSDGQDEILSFINDVNNK